MEVNKEEAIRCRDMGASALRSNNYDRAIKMLNKSLHLYPLPGVKALLDQAEQRKLRSSSNSSNNSRSGDNENNDTNSNNNGSSNNNGFASTEPPSRSSSSASMNSNANNTSTSATTGADGRTYTTEQLSIVQQVLKHSSSTNTRNRKHVHYKVLNIQPNATDADIKKAYRKLALKLHPDKNSAPHADEAFKAVGLAYATLSDVQKRRIYDMSGEEDPDNRGGGAARRGGHGNMHFHGQDVTPEDIFNMFFGGGMPPGAGGGGM